MHDINVAIIGGGPAGSTAGAMLKKYRPDLNVLILERERFPRDHVGESQLPAVSAILDEMGCWDAVEAAGFPIKVGATYLWGKSPELWDFDFMPVPFIEEVPRPGRFEGQRRHLAFQVDRAIYDDILLRHAASLGCEVREETRVLRVGQEGDRVSELVLDTGEVVTAGTYFDASGHSGILRRAMGVGVTHPTRLQNIAVWDYWRNAAWAEEIGVGGTRVQVMSVGYGWLWFIPLGPDRTSVGLVVPAEYYRRSGCTPGDLYRRGIADCARITELLVGAEAEGKLTSTKDWSFLADRHSGENWFLVGESGGFADPILAAGLTITHAAAREAAFTVLEQMRGGDPAWLRESYDCKQTHRLTNHIRFADYWYSANTQFSELQQFTAEIARDNGLDLEPQRAWAWLAQGGFIDDELGAGIAGFALPLIHDLGDHLGDLPRDMAIVRNNVFRLNLADAEERDHAFYESGRVLTQRVLSRAGKMLPVRHEYARWIEWLAECERWPDVRSRLVSHLEGIEDESQRARALHALLPALEAMIAEGWVEARYDPELPTMNLPRRYATIHRHES